MPSAVTPVRVSSFYHRPLRGEAPNDLAKENFCPSWGQWLRDRENLASRMEFAM